jgi:hypothetical protein
MVDGCVWFPFLTFLLFDVSSHGSLVRTTGLDADWILSFVDNMQTRDREQHYRGIKNPGARKYMRRTETLVPSFQIVGPPSSHLR